MGKNRDSRLVVGAGDEDVAVDVERGDKVGVALEHFNVLSDPTGPVLLSKVEPFEEGQPTES